MILGISPSDWLGIASLVIGIVSLVIAIWFYRKSKLLKRITYDIISDTPVMSIKRQVGGGHVKLEYQDLQGHSEEINDGRLLTLRVVNSGNIDIKIWNSDATDIEDMEEPIQFEFDQRTVVCLTEVKTEPTGLIAPNQLDVFINKPPQPSNILGLPRCILKQNQQIELTALLKGKGKKIKVKGKIINGEIKNFDEILEERNKSENLMSYLVYPVIVLLMIWVAFFIPFHIGPTSELVTEYLASTTILSILFLLWVIHRITHPYKCSCGFVTRFTGRFRRHVFQSHHRMYF